MTRGRPRRSILFFKDVKANLAWNSQRGKTKSVKSPLQVKLSGSYKRLKEQLCKDWGVPPTTKFEFLSELEYHQDDLPAELEEQLHAARKLGAMNRLKGGRRRADDAAAEFKRLMTHPNVAACVIKVAGKRLTVNAASVHIIRNWSKWGLEGDAPSSRKLRDWIASSIK